MVFEVGRIISMEVGGCLSVELEDSFQTELLQIWSELRVREGFLIFSIFATGG
jgi:hypothetical protein